MPGPNLTFQEGKLAASMGKDASMRPYDILITDYDEWAAGYDHVAETDEDGEVKEGLLLPGRKGGPVSLNGC